MAAAFTFDRFSAENLADPYPLYRRLRESSPSTTRRRSASGWSAGTTTCDRCSWTRPGSPPRSRSARRTRRPRGAGDPRRRAPGGAGAAQRGPAGAPAHQGPGCEDLLGPTDRRPAAAGGRDRQRAARRDAATRRGRPGRGAGDAAAAAGDLRADRAADRGRGPDPGPGPSSLAVDLVGASPEEQRRRRASGSTESATWPQRWRTGGGGWGRPAHRSHPGTRGRGRAADRRGDHQPADLAGLRRARDDSEPHRRRAGPAAAPAGAVAAAGDDPDMVPRWWKETLRIDAPVQGMFRRAVFDVQVSGVTIPAGAQVFALFAAANRDGAVFDRPDEFDPGRPTRTAPRVRPRYPLLSRRRAGPDGGAGRAVHAPRTAAGAAPRSRLPRPVRAQPHAPRPPQLSPPPGDGTRSGSGGGARTAWAGGGLVRRRLWLGGLGRCRRGIRGPCGGSRPACRWRRGSCR